MVCRARVATSVGSVRDVRDIREGRTLQISEAVNAMVRLVRLVRDREMSGCGRGRERGTLRRLIFGASP